MKKTSALLLAIILFQYCDKNDLEEQTSIKTFENVKIEQIKLDTKMDITQVLFVNEEVGFLAGDAVDTLSIGQNSISLDSVWNYNGEIPGIIFFDVDYEVHAKFDAPLFKTTNGGYSWEPVSFFRNKSSILDIEFIDDKIGFLLTSKNGGFKTKDGGITWDKIIDDNFFVIDSFSFGKSGGMSQLSIQDENTWFSYSPNGQSAFKTEDAGKNWSVVAYPGYDFGTNMPKNIKHMHFNASNPNIGCLSTNYTHEFYKTANGGDLWEKTNTLKANYLQLLKNGVIYLTTANEIYKSIDGGFSWNNIKFQVSDARKEFRNYDFYQDNWFNYDSEVEAFYVTPTSNIYCFFGYEKIYKLNHINGRFIKMAEISPNGGGFLRKIYFYSDELGFVYGDNGLLFRYSLSK